MALFTPVYGLLIIGLLWYAAVNPSYSSRTDNALLWAMQRIARWLPWRSSSTARAPWLLGGLVRGRVPDGRARERADARQARHLVAAPPVVGTAAADHVVRARRDPPLRLA